MTLSGYVKIRFRPAMLSRA